MRPMIWLGGIAVVIIACITPALTETLTCSTFQGIRTWLWHQRLREPRNRMAGQHQRLGQSGRHMVNEPLARHRDDDHHTAAALTLARCPLVVPTVA
jgi:hypothetical protein